MGIVREAYVEDLLQALTKTDMEQGKRRGEDKKAFSFDITPDHRYLSFQKISNNITVRGKKNCRKVFCLAVMNRTEHLKKTKYSFVSKGVLLWKVIHLIWYILKISNISCN